MKLPSDDRTALVLGRDGRQRGDCGFSWGELGTIRLVSFFDANHCNLDWLVADRTGQARFQYGVVLVRINGIQLLHPDVCALVAQRTYRPARLANYFRLGAPRACNNWLSSRDVPHLDVEVA